MHQPTKYFAKSGANLPFIGPAGWLLVWGDPGGRTGGGAGPPELKRERIGCP